MTFARGLRCSFIAPLLAGTVLVLGGLWLRAQQAAVPPLPSLFPPGALLYLEAKDFHALLSQWSSSAEKKSWEASDNFGEMSRSRLVQRLADAQTEFASVAGVSLQFNLLDQMSGVQSGFAFYDLPTLKFVYLTRLDSSRVEASELWRSRGRYQSRQVAGISFFVKSDVSTHRSVCFSSYKGWLAVATDEDRMAQTLLLLSGAKAASLSTEQWFEETTKQAASEGDLRLVYDLNRLLPTAQFRTYWIQRNGTELKAFSSGVADLFEQKDGFEEQRTLLRKNAVTSSEPAPQLDEITRFLPEKSSLYRVWARPAEQILTAVLENVVVAEPAENPEMDRYAPTVSAEPSEMGSTSDLETRIDQPPFERKRQRSVSGLVKTILAAEPVALLHIQATTVMGDQVFVMPQSAVVIECQHPDLAAVERALAETTDITQTGTLDPLHVELAGNSIILSRLAIRRRDTVAPLEQGFTYKAVYQHAEEWPHYKKLFGLIDRAPVNPEMPAAERTPTFFSGNVQSLGDTLRRLRTASITAREEGVLRRETVRYELEPR